LIRPGAYDANEFSLPEVFKISNMIQDVLMREDDNYMVAGQIGILDCSGVTMAHFKQFNPTFIKKITMLTQDASPTRQKGFHFINTPFGFDSIFNIFKSFINDKNKTKLYVHGSNLSTTLYKMIPQKLMPQEYGGESNFHLNSASTLTFSRRSRKPRFDHQHMGKAHHILSRLLQRRRKVWRR
jgi:hypothetical protein